jgi:hypothetical protein
MNSQWERLSKSDSTSQETTDEHKSQVDTKQSQERTKKSEAQEEMMSAFLGGFDLEASKRNHFPVHKPKI